MLKSVAHGPDVRGQGEQGLAKTPSESPHQVSSRHPLSTAHSRRQLYDWRYRQVFDASSSIVLCCDNRCMIRSLAPLLHCALAPSLPRSLAPSLPRSLAPLLPCLFSIPSHRASPPHRTERPALGLRRHSASSDVHPVLRRSEVLQPDRVRGTRRRVDNLHVEREVGKVERGDARGSGQVVGRGQWLVRVVNVEPLDIACIHWSDWCSCGQG
jgi:hypothetical protein